MNSIIIGIIVEDSKRISILHYICIAMLHIRTDDGIFCKDSELPLTLYIIFIYFTQLFNDYPTTNYLYTLSIIYLGIKL